MNFGNNHLHLFFSPYPLPSPNLVLSLSLSLSLSFFSLLVSLTKPTKRKLTARYSHRYLDFQINPTSRVYVHGVDTCTRTCAADRRVTPRRVLLFQTRFSPVDASPVQPFQLLPFRFSLLFRGAAPARVDTFTASGRVRDVIRAIFHR